MTRMTTNRRHDALTDAKLGVLLTLAYVLMIPLTLVTVGGSCWLAVIACNALYHVLGGN